MTLLERSTSAINTLHELCKGFSEGKPPDQYSVLGAVNDITNLYKQVAEEQARMFGGSQRTRLQRKIEEAKAHRSFREAGKTLGDADRDAMLEVGEEYNKEIDSMEAYEMYVALMNSLDRAARFGLSAQSAVKKQESSASNQ